MVRLTRIITLGTALLLGAVLAPAVAPTAASAALPVRSNESFISPAADNYSDPTPPGGNCPITKYFHTGYKPCGFDTGQLDWGGGNTEYFTVGTDYAIWHIWLGAGNWQYLGGRAHAYTAGAMNGAYAYNYPYAGVGTRGTDGNFWCRDWQNNWASGWFRCQLIVNVN